jgi:penicillin-binding protein 2
LAPAHSVRLTLSMRSFWRKKEYRIDPDRDDWVVPEETLVDAASQLSDIELPVGEEAFRWTRWMAVAACGVLVGGLFWLGVFRNGELEALAWRNRTVNVAVPPPRGIIMDRNGIPLVHNVPSFDLLVIGRQIRRTDDRTFPDIEMIAQAIGRNPEELTLLLNDNLQKNAVFFLATDISREAVLTFNNALPVGFYVITSVKRQYPDGPQFSHLLGYVGKVSKADIAEDPYYLPSDIIGRLGIEASYETTLRGDHGQIVFDTTQAAEAKPSQAGGNMVLNIDRDTQQALWKALWDILRETGLTQATAIAQDPQSGAVLAMVSFPSYDNNVFSGPLSQSDVEELFNGRTRPLFNRSISGRYNPGSTIKPFIGMAALEEKIIRNDQIVNTDCISISFPNPGDPSNPYVFENWRRDLGPFTLNRAIADSCNIYFFTVGGGFGNIDGLGITRIVKYLKSAFSDSILGVDLPGEETGFVPTPEWKRMTKKEPWYQGDTYNISIGQGDLLVTPLWLNSYISAIANGGTMWKPQVASRVVDANKNTITAWQPVELGSLPFSADVISQMQQAMRKTVTEGTARLLQDIGVTAAAKTGTAEVIKGQRINSLLTVYAPAENPKIALTILVEGSAENQGYALRSARQFLTWYFGPRTTPTPSPSPSPTLSPSLEPSPSSTPGLPSPSIEPSSSATPSMMPSISPSPTPSASVQATP